MTRYALPVLLALCLLAPTASAYTPTLCSGPAQFDDVPNAHPFCPWIEELSREEISTGCATGPSRFCPDAPVTRAQAAELLGKALHQHLWGEGRPNVTRVYGVPNLPFETLCSAGGGVFMGLSKRAVSWEGAASACPAAYWVCTQAERGTSVCNTLRPDDDCDAQQCDGSCFDADADEHVGWLADGAPDDAAVAYPRFAGQAATEQGTVGSAASCTLTPVWCCTR